MENKNVKELFYPMHLNIQYSIFKGTLSFSKIPRVCSLVLLTLNLLAPTTVGARINARTACAYIRRRSFGNADSPLLVSECPICQH